MAKNKSEKNVEKILESALVKKEDQPYELPGNWVWVRLGSILSLEYGKGLIKKERSGKGYPVYGSNGIVGYHSKALIEGPAIIVGRKGSIGEINWSDDECWPIDTTYYVKTNDNINLIYLYHLLKNLDFKKLNRATAIPGLNREDAYEYKISLPPLPEQTRIVQKLSSMLGKLKQAGELVQEARDTFEERRAAILHKAFTGELTKKWREENSADFENDWSSMRLGELVKFSKEKYDPAVRNDSFYYIGLEHIHKNQGIIDKGLSDDIKSLKNLFYKEDILYGKLRPYLNKHDIADFDGICSTDILVIKCRNTIVNKFLNYHFDLPSFIQYCVDNSKGINLPRISEKEISNYMISVPPLAEQKEIIRILDRTLNSETEAKALIDLEEQIDLIEKSILSKAFRGELGTNDPNDEPAMELLKRTLFPAKNQLFP